MKKEDLKDRLKNCHALLQWADSRLDPEQNRRLHNRIYEELKDCDDGIGPCSEEKEA